MKPLSLLPLAVYGLLGLVVTAAFSAVMLTLGFPPFFVSPLGGIASVVLALLLLIAGNGVRRLREGKPTRMTPIWAFRIALLARASAGVNATIVGCWSGLAVSLLPWIEASGARSAALWALFAALCALIWATVGVIVERWCQIDSDDTDAAGSTAGAASSSRHTPLTGGV